jgi:hypothetical protein
VTGRVVPPGDDELAYAEQVGEQLRRVRTGLRGLSLFDVERDSGGEFRASVLGAYERGERAISVRRMARLAAFYGVPTAWLLPDSGEVACSHRFRCVLCGEQLEDSPVTPGVNGPAGDEPGVWGRHLRDDSPAGATLEWVLPPGARYGRAGTSPPGATGAPEDDAR